MTISEKQLLLFKKIQYYRLFLDLRKIETELLKNVSSAINVNDSFFKQQYDILKNNIKNSKSSKLNMQKEAVCYNLQKLKSNQEIDFNKAIDKQLIIECFGNDNPDFSKILFAISVIYDSEFNYLFVDDELSEISNILFDDSSRLNEIKFKFESIYKNLSKKPLTTTQKGIILGTTTLTAILLVAAPIVAVGGIDAAASTTTALLAGFGFADMQVGIGMLALYSTLLCGAIVGTTYLSLKESNKEKIKQDFKNMNFDDATKLLTIKTLLFEETLKYKLPEAKIKEILNDLLAMIQDFKADTDYLLFVEKDNVENNKRKINLFHNFDQYLMKVCGVL